VFKRFYGVKPETFEKMSAILQNEYDKLHKSGGERNRLNLAMMLKEGANLLLLDEPTNDLDVNTLRALEEALDSFAGVSLVISHDRWFLDRIATHIHAFEPEGVIWHDGNWSEYAGWRREKYGAAADGPGKQVYRKLER